jgi:hypothetical protein
MNRAGAHSTSVQEIFHLGSGFNDPNTSYPLQSRGAVISPIAALRITHSPLNTLSHTVLASCRLYKNLLRLAIQAYSCQQRSRFQITARLRAHSPFLMAHLALISQRKAVYGLQLILTPPPCLGLGGAAPSDVKVGVAQVGRWGLQLASGDKVAHCQTLLCAGCVQAYGAYPVGHPTPHRPCIEKKTVIPLSSKRLPLAASLHGNSKVHSSHTWGKACYLRYSVVNTVHILQLTCEFLT